MGRKAEGGGVSPKGDRIQITFQFNGKQVRPTLNLSPLKEKNLQHARKMRVDIIRRIKEKTFKFEDFFPDYRHLDVIAPPERRLFKQVADDYFQSIGGLEYATRESYRLIIDYWKTVSLGPDEPPLAERDFDTIKYGELARFVGSHSWGTNKTRNNKVSVLRCVFDYGYADIEGKRNPAEKLEMLRVQKPQPDPYTLDEALAIIADARQHWGESYGNYVEFQFFAGARPSETIALKWAKVDQRKGTIRIDEARVMAQDKGTTKTAVSRDVEAYPRVMGILERQFELTGEKGENVFGNEAGDKWHDLQVPWRRWKAIHKRLKIRYREPYQARHTSVTWNLMLDKNLLWVARNHGHSPAVMLKTYAKWIDRTTEEDIQAIKRAFDFSTRSALKLVRVG
jgi:integrase